CGGSIMALLDFRASCRSGQLMIVIASGIAVSGATLGAQGAPSPDWVGAWLRELGSAQSDAAGWYEQADIAIALAILIGVLGVVAGVLPAFGHRKTKMIGAVLAALIGIGTVVKQAAWNVDPDLLKEYAASIDAEADAIKNTIANEWSWTKDSGDAEISKWRVETN